MEFNYSLKNKDYSLEDICKICVAVGMEKKAFRPVLIDLKPQHGFTDFFVILSASNNRQTLAIAEDIRRLMRKSFRLKPLAKDGIQEGQWVLLDFGSFIIHVFQESTREMYRLEELWSKGRFVNLEEKEVMSLYKETLALLQTSEENEDEV